MIFNETDETAFLEVSQAIMNKNLLYSTTSMEGSTSSANLSTASMLPWKLTPPLRKLTLPPLVSTESSHGGFHHFHGSFNRVHGRFQGSGGIFRLFMWNLPWKIPQLLLWKLPPAFMESAVWKLPIRLRVESSNDRFHYFRRSFHYFGTPWFT